MNPKPARAVALLAAGLFASSFIPGWVGRLLSFILAGGIAAFLVRILAGHSQTGLATAPLPDTPPNFLLKEKTNLQDDVPLQCLTREYRFGQRRETEAALSGALGAALKAFRGAVDCHTIAVFFIGKTNSVYLRAWSSQSEEHIIPGAVISPGQGLVGVLAKEAGTTRIENDLVANSRTLYYYSENVGVRSFLGVPILVDGLFRGLVTFDHTQPGRFNESHLEMARNFATAIGHLCLQAYMQLEHRIDRERVSAL